MGYNRLKACFKYQLYTKTVELLRWMIIKLSLFSNVYICRADRDCLQELKMFRNPHNYFFSAGPFYPIPGVNRTGRLTPIKSIFFPTQPSTEKNIPPPQCSERSHWKVGSKIFWLNRVFGGGKWKKLKIWTVLPPLTRFS